MSDPRPAGTVQLGATAIRVAPLGVGAMSWANRSLLGYGGADSPAAEEQALEVSLAAGVTLVDTAEAYGWGRTERRVGELARARPEVVVATKYAPYPFRRARALPSALQRSLARLGRIDLYQIHWPPRFVAAASLLRAMAAAHRAGQIRAIGVSNFSATGLRAAHAALAAEGIPLASNQVQYSLVHRAPETDGVLDACRELEVTLIAYSPLGMGVLTGKYGPGRRPGGIRRVVPHFRAGRLAELEPLLALLREIADQHDATPSQVALRWLIEQHALPIPGAKNAQQAATNAGALTLALEPAEVDALTAWKR